MSRLATSFVLGYHGCDRSVAADAVLNGAGVLQSDRDYDWLGPGAYFWESDPRRALEWAKWKSKRGDYQHPAVIGAVIDLGNCLDLVVRENLDLLKQAHSSFLQVRQESGLPIPENRNPTGTKNKDRLLRFLDCAVLRHLHATIDELAEHDESIRPFDTVRGMFVEGGRLYTGSGFHRKSHIQIAVRNADCIKGIFYPLDSGREVPGH